EPAKRPDLDASGAAAAGGRDFGGPLDRLVDVAAVEDVVARELLPGLRERAVGQHGLAPFEADRLGGRGGGGGRGSLEDPAPRGLVHDGAVPLDDLVSLFRRRAGFRLLGRVDQHHVAHGASVGGHFGGSYLSTSRDWSRTGWTSKRNLPDFTSGSA